MDAGDGHPGDVEATLGAWRAKALNALLIAAAAIAMPAIVLALTGVHQLALGYRITAVAIYLVLVATAFFESWGVRRRSWIALLLSYALAILALLNRGLIGYGRIGLAVYPFWVMLLMGSRAGWISAASSLAIYALFATLAATGVLQDWQMLDHPTDSITWMVQGILLAMGMLPGLALLHLFRQFHMRTLEAERRGVTRLEEEVARRTEAGHALQHELAERHRLEQRITQIGQEERRRFRHEIHDGLCQQLTAALLNCSALETQLTSGGTANATHVGRLRELLEKTLGEAYEISRGISPVGADPKALIEALEMLAQRTSQVLDLFCEFHQDGESEIIDSQMSQHLYRIAQEAVSNAAKHGHAQHIWLRLRSFDSQVVLEVEDDGCGLPNGKHMGQGRGLHIMQYRARCMGGELAVTPGQHGGTVVTCTVPLEQANVGGNPS